MKLLWRGTRVALGIAVTGLLPVTGGTADRPAAPPTTASVRLGQAPGIKTQAALFRDRMGHPGPALTLLNAYCHFAVIYHRSPIGLALPIPFPDIPLADHAALNRLLQELAWAAVTNRPLSGVAAGDGQPQ